MARAFTQYWKNTTWAKREEGYELGHSASNEFRKRDIQRGDRIFIVTNMDGELYLGTALLVDEIVGTTQARKIFGNDVWNADDHIIARSSNQFHKSLRVPQKIVRALRFAGNKPLVFKKDGTLDRQTLRGVRELTDESAVFLEELLTSADKKTNRGKASHAIGGSSDVEALRNDADAVRVVFDLIFASVTPENRRRWESFLADSIDYAASRYPDRWVAVLEPTYIRTTVGMVRCLHLSDDEDQVVLLSREGAPEATRWSGGRYQYAPGCEEAYVSRTAGAGLLGSTRGAHFRAIDACGQAHAGNNQRRQAHSPAVLRYLEGALGRKLPDPSYTGAEDRVFESHPCAKELAEERSILTDAALSVTEKEALITARRGQGRFRDNVSRAEPQCRVTKITDPDYLRASHIKPWSESSNAERLSANNGLMLSPHVDHLFDQGYISFSDAGDLLVSPRCSTRVLAAWRIPLTLNVGPFRPAQHRYLKYHREHRFQQ